jgi:hypothetical protein
MSILFLTLMSEGEDPFDSDRCDPVAGVRLGGNIWQSGDPLVLSRAKRLHLTEAQSSGVIR